jgi:putative phosphoribosyl transferase
MQQIIFNNSNNNHNEVYENKISVNIPVDNFSLNAYLYLPEQPAALVIFSHGSGSSRFSSRNSYVAESLCRNNMAVLLADLLTPHEDANIQNRFNISLLTERLKQITQWAAQYQPIKNLPVGYFGASTGAASALNAAADLKDEIKAVVSRGGRPDLARENALRGVVSPTLLIVGSLDNEIISLNKKAFQKLKCKKNIEIVRGASHLFEEKGKLHIVSELAAGWFDKYLVSPVVQSS